MIIHPKKFRPECDIHYLLLFSLPFKMFSVQEQEQPPCAQSGTQTLVAELTDSALAESTQLCSGTLLFPKRVSICYGC